MTSYKPPCSVKSCETIDPSKLAIDVNQKLCSLIARNIIREGGSGLLETYICPLITIDVIKNGRDDPWVDKLANRLGTWIVEWGLEA